MKQYTDPRHKARQQILKNLFAASFLPKHPEQQKTDDSDQYSGKIKDIFDNLQVIDQYILQAAPQWPIEKIAKIDLAILRLAIYELKIEKTQPEKVIIDEAVELAKEYGAETSSSFINGALGALLKN